MESPISGEIKLCEAGECSYLRPLRTNILKSILRQITRSDGFNLVGDVWLHPMNY
ncbi:progonadoliberin-2 [Clarias magur]|uniref:Progonadoliberin-2 n=1 Tax=Clarias magur TaxID=1594786 RepID=A0A8J4UCQ4_CLAMG|nr:progonadoliberin-2 [Clarias magur]